MLSRPRRRSVGFHNKADFARHLGIVNSAALLHADTAAVLVWLLVVYPTPSTFQNTVIAQNSARKNEESAIIVLLGRLGDM